MLNSETLRFLRYLSFKVDCLREQEANPLTLDVEKAQRHYDELQVIITEKIEALREVMPKVPQKTQRNKPKNLYKKDGTYSEAGKRWVSLLKSQGLPKDTEGPVWEVTGYAEGNPKSTQQVKEWLDSMGWEPCTYKYQRNKTTGEEKKIPQVRYSSPSDPRKGQLTESVLRLKDKVPEVEILEGLTVAQHRSSIFEGFLKSHTSGKIISSAGGFTNTLRLKHRAPIVNLPGVEAAWGKEIRGCLITPEYSPSCIRGCEGPNYPCCTSCANANKMVLCGSDVSSLESCTKRHFMWPHDPAYVTEMSEPGFDEHLDLAKHAGRITEEDLEEYKGGGRKDLKPLRTKFKATNYSAVYGVGSPKLSRELGITKGEAQSLLDAYWERNWAVKKVSQEQYVKTLKDGTMWLKNPVSGFYYSLRYEKDIFSTLNQGTGVFIFDSWVMRMRRKGIDPQLQYHDEVLFGIPKGTEGKTKEALEEAMREVNESLKLNVDIGVDVNFGGSYSEVH